MLMKGHKTAMYVAGDLFDYIIFCIQKLIHPYK